MQVRELFTALDRMRPNAFTDGEKLYFLNTIEGRIYREILEKAEPLPPVCLPSVWKEKPEEEKMEEEKTEEETEKELSRLPCFRPFREGEEMRELAVPVPYTDIYLYYLAAMIDFHNGDSSRYNDTMVLFNQAWADFAACYRQTHKPRQTNLTGMLPHRGYGQRGAWFR